MSTTSIAASAGRRLFIAAAGFVTLLSAGLGLPGDAGAYSARVKNACRSDYYRFCPGYKEDDPKLKACMRSAGGNISRRCRDALADGGYISRKYHSSQLGR